MDKFKYYIQQFPHYKIGQFLPPRVTVYWPFILPRKRSKLREVTKIKSAKNGLPMRLFEMAKNDKKLKIALQNRVPRVRVLLPLPNSVLENGLNKPFSRIFYFCKYLSSTLFEGFIYTYLTLCFSKTPSNAFAIFIFEFFWICA